MTVRRINLLKLKKIQFGLDFVHAFCSGFVQRLMKKNGRLKLNLALVRKAADRYKGMQKAEVDMIFPPSPAVDLIRIDYAWLASLFHEPHVFRTST